MTDKYTKETKLEEVMKSPDARDIISKFNIPCLHCPMAAYEAKMLTLGQISSNYGIDLDGLLKELNSN